MRKPRDLSPEERALWERVASQTERLTPMRATGLAEAKAPESEPDPPEKMSIPVFRIGTQAPRTAPTPKAATAHVAMDHKAFRKLKRGKLAPEARLDLHGMTLEQAHTRLLGFIDASAARGLRLVLIITGKGRPGSDNNPIPSRPGVLRRQVPHWLRAMPMILQITQASRKHGGEGALYVYLRRRRS